MTGEKNRLCEVENQFLNEECSIEELLGDVSSKQKKKNDKKQISTVKDSMEEDCEKEKILPGKNSKKDSTQKKQRLNVQSNFLTFTCNYIIYLIYTYMFQLDYTEGKQSGSIITVTEHCSVNSAFELTAEEFDSLFNGQNENGDQQSSKLIQKFFFILFI